MNRIDNGAARCAAPLLLVVTICAALSCALAAPAVAADVTLEYKRGGAGVSDETTKLNVAKVGSDGGEYVVGAHMAIFTQEDYDAGDLSDPVDSWWTANEVHHIAKNARLNASADAADATRYVLVELAAPDGYQKADPVSFYLLSDSNFETTAVILTGAEKADGSQNCVLADKFSFALYDDALPDERTVTVTKRGEDEAVAREGEGQTSKQASLFERLAQTGDLVAPIVPALALGLAAIGLGLVARHKKSGHGATSHDDTADKERQGD
ncbi:MULTISPECIES: hypothetical protein [Atopobiaceae]|uniref:DUF2167 domain-containing protein n=1 Tax=Parafannyhessea umbonata TaxID=604330 RepID=A0A1H6ISC5_9ACTN|nr:MULTISPECIES: hypothetical protein [Atopobiaceae]SEH51766.1 hypothetical protein SAMN05216447_104117 [Parafannyhessea umbonata]SJZ73959.1 hypothetical protein SAMN06298223_1271 [Olsenella sp. KH1P3]